MVFKGVGWVWITEKEHEEVEGAKGQVFTSGRITAF